MNYREDKVGYKVANKQPTVGQRWTARVSVDLRLCGERSNYPRRCSTAWGGADNTCYCSVWAYTLLTDCTINQLT